MYTSAKLWRIVVDVGRERYTSCMVERRTLLALIVDVVVAAVLSSQNVLKQDNDAIAVGWFRSDDRLDDLVDSMEVVDCGWLC